MKKLLLLLFAAVACVYSFGQSHSTPAQNPVAAGEKPTREQVLKLLELLQVRDSMQITLDAMKEQVKATAEQGLREKIPNPTADQLKSVNLIVESVFKDLALDDLLQDVVPVYQRHLTRSDVQAIINFYSSPAGKKILREQPAMIRESMQATATAQQRKMELLLVKLDLRMQQLIESEQQKSAPERK